MPVSTFHSTPEAEIMDDLVRRTVRLVVYLIICTGLEYPTHEDIHSVYETFKFANFNVLLYGDICRLTHLYIAEAAMAFNIATLTIKITPLIIDTLKRVVQERGLKWRPGSSYFLRKNKKRLQMEVFDVDDGDLGLLGIVPEPLLRQQERLRGGQNHSSASINSFITSCSSNDSLDGASPDAVSPDLPFSHLHWEQVKLFAEDSTSAIPYLGEEFLKVIISIITLDLGVFLKKDPEDIVSMLDIKEFVLTCSLGKDVAISYVRSSCLAASPGPSFIKGLEGNGEDYESEKARRLMGAAYGFLLLTDTREADRWLTDHWTEVVMSAFMSEPNSTNEIDPAP